MGCLSPFSTGDPDFSSIHSCAKNWCAGPSTGPGPDRAITAEQISDLFEYFRDFIGHRDMLPGLSNFGEMNGN